MQQNKTKILIVDDYNIFRSGIRKILEEKDEIDVVGEVANIDELFGLLNANQADVIILNLMLPAKKIIYISKKLSKNYPNIPFILLTFGASEYLVLECVFNGAAGVLWKESTPDNLFAAIEAVVSGKKYLDIPESQLSTNILKNAEKNDFNNHDFSELSKREREVLKLFADGHSYKFIADKLKISPRTVESHKNKILKKLKLDSTIDMVKYAIKHGIIYI